jgi:hypothetical protein
MQTLFTTKDGLHFIVSGHESDFYFFIPLLYENLGFMVFKRRLFFSIKKKIILTKCNENRVIFEKIVSIRLFLNFL